MKKNILLLFTILFTLNVMAQKTENNGPQIHFNDKIYNYDTISRGSSGECFFEFENIGNEPLIITSAFSSCGCTVPSWPKEPILPNMKGEIKIKYNTEKFGSFSKVIVVKSNSTDNEKTILRINGVVKKE